MTGIYLREHKLALCAQCYPHWFEKQVAETIRKYKMLQPTDRIILAVSGGKDSLSLWQILTKLGYSVDAVYIKLGIGKENYSEISYEKCLAMQKKLGGKLLVVDIEKELGTNLDGMKKIFPKICSTCGTIKRYYMNKITRQNHYTVVATGHNLDDEVATLFGNLIKWDEGYLKRQYPVIPEREGLARKIKPLVFRPERQVALYAITSGIDYIKIECPYSFSATSISYKENLNRLEMDHPGILRFFLQNFFQSKKDNPSDYVELKPCLSCQEPTTTVICKVCRIKEKIKKHDEK